MSQKRQVAPGFGIRNSRTSPALFCNSANRKAIYELLSSPEIYWGQGRSQAVIDRQISNAYICFGVFKLPLGDEGREDEAAEVPSLVGFSRVIGDGERFAYMADVFVLPEYRGLGLGRELIIETVVNSGDPSVSDDPVSRDSREWKWILFATKAKDMYLRLGFAQETTKTYELQPGNLRLG
ncbi:hypothetical protein C8J57DRAFT_1279491 [Mycena rebaudengoi]|nr:hypothetical protein C8J57DRAFT_1279491 [Mycena rebaudengoi]